MNNRKVIQEALNVLPGGVNSPVRAFKAVGGEPIALVKGRGCRIWDADGREYLDFLASWGPLILGHAHPKVVKAVKEEAEKGLSFGLTNPHEVKLAQLVVELVPSVEKVRFVNSGTEATMSAVRLARGVTGRKLVVKFDGCYHGHYDSLLVSAGSGVATFAIPGTPGIPEEIASLTLVVPYNDEGAVREVFEKHGRDIACLIVEPVAGNMGVVPPKEGFLKFLRDITRENGSLLIFDEVITGFRLSKGGAQELFGVEPDITCLGKVLGGGMPVGAYGGRREIMSQVAPEGPVYQAGTLSGNPVAMAAGVETLKELRDKEPYGELDGKARTLSEGVSSLLKDRGIAHRINRVGSMFTVFFTDREVTDFASAKSSDTELFGRFFRKLLDKGVLIPPAQFEAWFVSTAHEDEHIDEALSRIADAVKEL
ncbi:glutamate-1-semialdehyde 2,1-aminomutase [Hydrogenivirga sp.]